MRLLVVTARFPTPDRPAAGSFVRDRLGGLPAVVIAPDRYDRPGWRRYLRLGWLAFTARGRFVGVEGHFVLPSGVVALTAARLRRLPLVVVAHGSDVGSIAHRSTLHRWLARRVLDGADAVVANSAATADAARALGAKRVEIVPPGVELGRFGTTPRPESRRVLYLGGTDPAKGPEVARELADTLAGPGIVEHDPTDVPALLAAHDVLLMPSRSEGYGLAAAEAIAAGRWVVAAAVGGLPDVISDGVNGTLAKGSSVDAFRAALATVPDYDPAAVAATAARFDIAHQRTAMDEVWKRVLAGRR
jgi:glycosyltransferase involved in cell wall biosynthesis